MTSINDKIKHFEPYPTMIAAVRAAIAELDKQISDCDRKIENAEVDTDIEIAYDGQLKNEAQRKAARRDMLRKHTVHGAQMALRANLQRQKLTHEITLERYRLALKLHIAELHAIAAIND